mmetsp:Transcript_12078/g.10678  ORF Transcript_12078/g.10678 Transcript_12078/m.10678 type:complete len:89 (+) Transcript_12078:688-954(+)
MSMTGSESEGSFYSIREKPRQSIMSESLHESFVKEEQNKSVYCLDVLDFPEKMHISFGEAMKDYRTYIVAFAVSLGLVQSMYVSFIFK